MKKIKDIVNKHSTIASAPVNVIPTLKITTGPDQGVYLQCFTFVSTFLDNQCKLATTLEEKEYMTFLAKEILEINGMGADFALSIPDGFQKLKGVDGLRTAEGEGGRYFNVKDLLETMKDHYQKARNETEKALIQYIATQLAQVAGIPLVKGGKEKIDNAGKIIHPPYGGQDKNIN